MTTRREFVSGLAAAGTASLVGLQPGPATAEPPPEVTRLRMTHSPSLCQSPQFVAEPLLRDEGFTDVQYTMLAGGISHQKLAAGEADLVSTYVGPVIMSVDKGAPLLILGGAHVGCFELVGNQRIRSIRDLKGKTVAVRVFGSTEHVFLSSMASYVGLDPGKDVNWVFHPVEDSIRLFVEGKIDGFMAFPPNAQELRAKRIGRVVVNSAVDRPWSQYFCCVLAANRDFVRKHPVATKRAMRAFLKANNMCALEPERVARGLMERGTVKSYEYALQTLRELPYGRWRDYDPEDTVRFYSLRLHEAGMVKSSPQKIIAQGTDWRSFNELKKELKG